MNDLAEKEFNRHCVYCKHYHNDSTCNKCLVWERERPFWTLETKSKPKIKIKRAVIPTIKPKVKIEHKRLEGFFKI